MLTIDAAGYEFSMHVKPTLEFVTLALMSTPYLESRVHQCAGSVMSALITTVGPELQAADEERNTIIGLSQELLRHPGEALPGLFCVIVFLLLFSLGLGFGFGFGFGS